MPSPRRLLAVLLLLLAACGRAPDVVIYCALDEEYAAPVLRAFEQETGLHVQAYYDVEANKSVGLRRRLQQEASRPICDVYWNNEVVQTVVLARGGLLQPYRSPASQGIGDRWRDQRDLWCGFAARGRVLIVNTDLRGKDTDRPEGLADFLDPANAGQCGIAEPLTGTTAAHAAAWIEKLGLPATLERFAAMRANRVEFAPGNAHVMRLVREGQLHFGWTDTDDYYVAKEDGYPVAVVYPDQTGKDGAPPLGTLVIPNSIALLADAPHPDAGKRFIDWVLSTKVEAELAASRTMQIPVRASVPRPAHVPTFGEGGLKAMQVDFRAVGAQLPERQQHLKELFVD